MKRRPTRSTRSGGRCTTSWFLPRGSPETTPTNTWGRDGPGWCSGSAPRAEEGLAVRPNLRHLNKRQGRNSLKISLVHSPPRCHKDCWLPCTDRSYYRRPYAIKNLRGASPKASCRGLLMLELVLHGIRLLAKQFLGTVLDRHRGGPVCYRSATYHSLARPASTAATTNVST